MTTFIVIGSLMVLLALAIVLWPMLRRAPAAGRRWTGVAIAIVAVPILACALYLTLTNWDWKVSAAPQAAVAPSQAEIPPFVLQMISGLEAKLKANPGDFKGWMMLGRSYFQLQRYDRSVEAYQRAYTLSRGGEIDAVVGLGEAMIYADPATMSGPAGELFEQGFQMAPKHPKVLWYSGVIAYQNGQLKQAHERWSALMQLGPPSQVKQVLAEKLAELEQKLATSPAAR